MHENQTGRARLSGRISPAVFERFGRRADPFNPVGDRVFGIAFAARVAVAKALLMHGPGVGDKTDLIWRRHTVRFAERVTTGDQVSGIYRRRIRRQQNRARHPKAPRRRV